MSVQDSELKAVNITSLGRIPETVIYNLRNVVIPTISIINLPVQSVKKNKQGMENNSRKKTYAGVGINYICGSRYDITPLEKINTVPDTMYINMDLEYTFICLFDSYHKEK